MTGLFFEEFEIGQTMKTRGRTITESDIVQFGALTGDFNPMHFDAEYMKSHMIGQRIAHGMLTISYAVGQAYQLGFLEGTVLAFRAIDMKFSQPVFIGDTIHVEIKVAETKPAERLGGGIVTFDVRIVNQDGKAVQKGTWTVLMASKPV
ncbi:MAG: dehydratase [Phototrophicales bacterium]|nr:MAG: dehydratase [Phototrophicales bacterium]RMG73972.1 MAG: dehydratase [Chloroflexota bacterium]